MHLVHDCNLSTKYTNRSQKLVKVVQTPVDCLFCRFMHITCTIVRFFLIQHFVAKGFFIRLIPLPISISVFLNDGHCGKLLAGHFLCCGAFNFISVGFVCVLWSRFSVHSRHSCRRLGFCSWLQFFLVPFSFGIRLPSTLSQAHTWWFYEVDLSLWCWREQKRQKKNSTA